MAASATRSKVVPALGSDEPLATVSGFDPVDEFQLNIDKCAFGSHNLITDTSHFDDCFNLNEQFVMPRDIGHILEKRAVACIASYKTAAGCSELKLDGVDFVEDESETLVMDEPVPAHHFLGIDISLHDAIGTKRKCVLSQHKYALHVLKYFTSISPGLIRRKTHTPCNDSVAVL